MQLVRIPEGSLGEGDSAARLGPFWMGRCEVTNRQYAQVDAGHDSRFEHRGSWIFSEEYLGWPLDAPDQPVVRVSWDEAVDFCEEVSRRTGRKIRLPSEEEWEYACRAETATPFWFGSKDADYTSYANLGDRSLRKLASDSWNPKPPDLVDRDDRFDDGYLVTAPVGSLAPNPFGLYDTHGNAAEWTLGRYGDQGDRKPVRGGSWRDLPGDCQVTSRYGYHAYQKVFNVGFRVVCETDSIVE
jgi:formylglycine-generating enzyme required for sulfatase activity